MINLDLPLIATAIGVIAALFKFASSISQFAQAVSDLKLAMQESKSDRRDLRAIVNRHETDLSVIKTQYGDIKVDLHEIKKSVKGGF
jgi:septal ring factor EnvC (AmiA/AmiB activator)